MSLEFISQARAFVDAVANGEVDPAEVQRLVDKWKARKNSRAPEPKLKATANPVVKRNSGLFVPAKYKEAIQDKKPIMVALFCGNDEISFEDYDRQEMIGGAVSFECKLADWGFITGYALIVGNQMQRFAARPVKFVRVEDTFRLKRDLPK